MNMIKYVYEPTTGRNYRLDEGRELSIGRAFDNHIVFDDVSISRHHACVGLKDGKVYVRDLHSTNGTVINGERITDTYSYELNMFDEFQVGALTLRILDQDAVIANNFKNNKMPGDTAIMASGC